MSVVDDQVLQAFKAAQRQSWVHFAAFEAITIPPAAQLVRFSGVQPGQRVLDVGCGTGPVALTAAVRGAIVTGLDLTPELLERAKESSRLGGIDVEWREGDAEQLPFADATFDVVLSQFGHIFAPRPEVAVAEMLRVLKPGGTIAFSTWPPELFTGRMFALVARYLPPPPTLVSPPWQWGNEDLVRSRLGHHVRDLTFARENAYTPAVSPRMQRQFVERTSGPLIRLVGLLEPTDPARLEAFRREYEALAAEYFTDNRIQQTYLMSRAVKS